MNIKGLIGETTEYDKKLAVEKRKVKSWLKSVSAFSNTAGGILIFGVSNDDEIVGLDSVKEDSEFISQKIKERIDPIPQINMHIKQVDGKNILLVEIFRGEETPYYYYGDSVMEAYIRLGNESIVADATELKRLVLRGKNSSFDSLSTGYKFDDYSFSKLRERYKQWTGNSFEDKLFKSFGIIDNNDSLTNAGAILADETPIYQNWLFCTRWNGLTKAGGLIDALDSDEYKGELISLLRDGESFIRRNTRRMWRKTPYLRIEMPEYVFQSASEALVNALIHRDYMIMGSEVHIDIFDDRMEIYSPGGMVNGSMIQNLDIRYVSSERRNPVLADIFNRLGLMERQGSGLSKIVESYKLEENYTDDKIPTFYSDRTQFRVILPNLNYGIDINKSNNEPNFDTNNDTNEPNSDTNQSIYFTKKELQVLKIIKINSKISQKQLSTKTGMSISSIKRITRRLNDCNYIERIGGTRGYWKVLKEIEE